MKILLILLRAPLALSHAHSLLAYQGGMSRRSFRGFAPLARSLQFTEGFAIIWLGSLNFNPVLENHVIG